MLDVSLHGVSFRHPKSGFALRDVTLTFPKSTHTAILGSGASTLLKLISGELRPENGEIAVGARPIHTLKPSRRPLLAVTNALDVPGRWSVRHALVAAVSRRTLDRIDRHHEHDLAVAKWGLGELLDRRVDTLSSTERARVHLARIELLRPALLLADRLLADAQEHDFYRTLRVLGTTVISAPASPLELGATDAVVVLEDGRVVQHGSAVHVYERPASEAAARATGPVNAIPITIRGPLVESVIGAWELAAPPFAGGGIALARPDDFHLVPKGGESDLILAVEEAAFVAGRWIIDGLISGGLLLRVSLPKDAKVHKGRLLALSYEPSRFTLLKSDVAQPVTIPTDVVPPMRESR